MHAFEKFIREHEKEFPNDSVAAAVALYDNTKVDYADDPLRWAMQIPDVVEYLQSGRLVSAVRLIRDQEQGPYGLRECKDLANQVEDALGIQRYRY